MKDNDPEGWQRAIEIDEALRREGNVTNRKMDMAMYLHKKCIPLQMVEFNTNDKKIQLIDFCDEGMCGL